MMRYSSILFTSSSIMMMMILMTSHIPSTEAFSPNYYVKNYHNQISHTTDTKLYMAIGNKPATSLKPAAQPLLASGKAMANSGEILISLTSTLNLYGGGLSATGANIRNSGDCIAQAAASMRFKTGWELVCDELREASNCLLEGVGKCKDAIEEAELDGDLMLKNSATAMVTCLEGAGVELEDAGRGIMQRSTIVDIGESIVKSGDNLEELAKMIETLGVARGNEGNDKEGKTKVDDVKKFEEATLSSQRMMYAAQQMREAGNNLKGVQKEKPKGKAWLKG